MILTGVLFSLFYAIILTIISVLVFKNKGPWESFWKFFIILFLIGLTSVFWLVPVGPVAWGYYWLPGLLIVFVFALLIASASTSDRSKNIKENDRPELTASSYYSPHFREEQKKKYSVDHKMVNSRVNIFFWVIIFLLIIFIISGIFLER